MAESKTAQASSPKGDLGQKEVQKGLADAQKQGYFGQRADAFPLEAHSLQSGPDAPTVLEQHTAALEQRAREVKASHE